MSNRGYDFRKWIEAGFKDYGKDPWFFIRELAQNSRDAGAAFIRVKIGYTSAKEEVLVFEDDGCGMSYHHAVRYLFRLYASSKDKEKYAAGLFGIGFWTVLRFNPGKIIIESRYKKDQWGIVVDVPAGLSTTRITGHLEHRGTRVTLIRRPRESSAREFWKKTRAALVRYCSYLRRNTQRAELLPVYFSDEMITNEMKLPGPVSMSFKKGSVEGAVGLAPQPRVELYARGLPVWQGTSLEELSHSPPTSPTPSAKKKQPPQEMSIGQGLAPVFLLNGNHLEVNISRRRVIDNRNLQKVRRTAEEVLARMVEAAADLISPRGMIRRFSDIMKRGVRPIFSSFSKILLISLLLIIPLEVLLLRALYKAPSKETIVNTVSLQAEQPYYPGASVRVTSPGKPLDLTYYPRTDTWFKLFTADDYHITSGFLQVLDKKEEVPLISLDCSGDARDPISVELNTRETGQIYLPQPVGYSVEFSSLMLNRVPLESARYHVTGEVVVSIPSGGMIRYRCCPVQPAGMTALSTAQRKKLTGLPADLSLPISLEKELQESVHLSIDNKVKTALRLTNTVLKYDDSAETAKKYAGFSGSSDWFAKVISIGVGDCDILNGVTALFLRKMGVPAQLVVGLVGKKGNVLPGLHAWTEYFDKDKGWRIIDASIHVQHVSGLSSSPFSRASRQPGEGISEPKEPGIKIIGKWKLPYRPFIYSLIGIFFLLLFFFFFMFFKMRRSRNLFQSRELSQVQEDLAGMVLHDLLHPGTWGRGTGIRDFKLIPTINSKHGAVSLRQALKWGTRRKLFTFNMNQFAADASVPDSETLVSYLKKASVPILDSGNPAFAPLVKLLPGAVHLESVFALKAVVPGRVGHQPTDFTDQLLAGVNQRLQAVNRKIPLCLLASGLRRADFFDVDLAPLPSLEKWGIPRRFIAVNPDGSRIKKLALLSRENPDLAQFRLISIILKESGLIPFSSAAIIEKACRQLINSPNKKLLWGAQKKEVRKMGR